MLRDMHFKIRFIASLPSIKCLGNLYPDDRELWKISKLQSHDGVVSRRPHIVHGEENKQSSESKQGKTNLTKQNWWNGKRERPGDFIWSAVITVYNAIFANGLKIQMKTLSHYLRLLGCAYVWVREPTHVCVCVCVPHNNQYLLPRLDTLPSYRGPSPQ